MEDTRNVLDEFKGLDHDEIVKRLDSRGVELEIAIENTLRDFNMGTIVRNANAFGVRTVYVIGKKQWNKRGAMATDKYLRVLYYETIADFSKAMKKEDKLIVAIENNVESTPMSQALLPKNTVMIFGQEGPGISTELLSIADETVHIEQLGSTRSINVGVASGIAMYEWLRRNNS
ncbi:MAG TPA: TrmH family RNA methyltransferase [Candidatus Saccharibacteria bacterium]|nr:TrmH family RNA methyltransferase [Candidatus Saccharibacteria bacterium]